MATQASATDPGLIPYRITARQFLKMVDAGAPPEGVTVEPLGGGLVARTKDDAHDFIVTQLGGLLRPLSCRPGRYWRPEPDIAATRAGRPRDRTT